MSTDWQFPKNLSDCIGTDRQSKKILIEHYENYGNTWHSIIRTIVYESQTNVFCVSLQRRLLAVQCEELFNKQFVIITYICNKIILFCHSMTCFRADILTCLQPQFTPIKCLYHWPRLQCLTLTHKLARPGKKLNEKFPQSLIAIIFSWLSGHFSICQCDKMTVAIIWNCEQITFVSFWREL